MRTDSKYALSHILVAYIPLVLVCLYILYTQQLLGGYIASYFFGVKICLSTFLNKTQFLLLTHEYASVPNVYFLVKLHLFHPKLKYCLSYILCTVWNCFFHIFTQSLHCLELCKFLLSFGFNGCICKVLSHIASSKSILPFFF